MYTNSTHIIQLKIYFCFQGCISLLHIVMFPACSTQKSVAVDPWPMLYTIISDKIGFIKATIVCLTMMYVYFQGYLLHHHHNCYLSFQHLASVGLDDHHTLNIWDWRRGKVVASTRGHSDRIFDVQFNPHSPTELVTCGVKHIKFWVLHGNSLSGKKGLFGKKGYYCTLTHTHTHTCTMLLLSLKPQLFLNIQDKLVFVILIECTCNH